MRFKLVLQVRPSVWGRSIPISYQYELSCAIYRILSSSDPQFASWLHSNGFTADNKIFRLFTFSHLNVPKYNIDKEQQRLIVLSDTVNLSITFLPQISTRKFIEGVFMEKCFQIGDKISGVEFMVREIQVMPPLEYKEEMNFETLSPACISKKREDGKMDYLSPTHSLYTKGLLTGLLARYKAFFQREYEGETFCDFQVLTEPKPVLIKIKSGTPQQTFVKGYRFKFKIRLPEELMNIMYESGFGEKGSMGFGMVKEIQTK